MNSASKVYPHNLVAVYKITWRTNLVFGIVSTALSVTIHHRQRHLNAAIIDLSWSAFRSDPQRTHTKLKRSKLGTQVPIQHEGTNAFSFFLSQPLSFFFLVRYCVVTASKFECIRLESDRDFVKMSNEHSASEWLCIEMLTNIKIRF